VVDFEALRHFFPKTEVQLQLPSVQAEDLSSWTKALEIVPKGCAMLAGSQAVDIDAAPAAKDI
jgi:hypothetical protein